MHSLSFEDLGFRGGAELKVFIDGALVDTVQVPHEPYPGQKIESPLITEALGERDLANVSFVGTMIMVTTQELTQEIL